VPEEKKLFDAFKSANTTDWQNVAREELNGANPFEKLTHRANGYTVQPYYHNTGASSAPLLSDSGNSFLGSRAWYNCPRVAGSDGAKMNEMALRHLQSGADGLLFELPSEISFEKLLKGIDWTYCSLNFLAKKNSSGLSVSLREFISKNKFRPDQIHGAFYGNEVLPTSGPGMFRFTGLQLEPNASPDQAIAKAYNKLISDGSGSFPSLASNVAFSVPLGNNFFEELSKIRAIRMVWQKLLKALGAKETVPLMIHCYSSTWIDDKYQPHGNMLKGTTASMAAILGGCDTLTVDAEDPQQEMMARVARNISNILREESHLSKVADPVAGSYFVENLSAQIADAAWNDIHLS
jgi:methylmalonyl-CoA mutase